MPLSTFGTQGESIGRSTATNAFETKDQLGVFETSFGDFAASGVPPPSPEHRRKGEELLNTIGAMKVGWESGPNAAGEETTVLDGGFTDATATSTPQRRLPGQAQTLSTATLPAFEVSKVSDEDLYSDTDDEDESTVSNTPRFESVNGTTVTELPSPMGGYSGVAGEGRNRADDDSTLGGSVLGADQSVFSDMYSDVSSSVVGESTTIEGATASFAAAAAEPVAPAAPSENETVWTDSQHPSPEKPVKLELDMTTPTADDTLWGGEPASPAEDNHNNTVWGDNRDTTVITADNGRRIGKIAAERYPHESEESEIVLHDVGKLNVDNFVHPAEEEGSHARSVGKLNPGIFEQLANSTAVTVVPSKPTPKPRPASTTESEPSQAQGPVPKSRPPSTESNPFQMGFGNLADVADNNPFAVATERPVPKPRPSSVAVEEESDAQPTMTYGF